MCNEMVVGSNPTRGAAKNDFTPLIQAGFVISRHRQEILKSFWASHEVNLWFTFRGNST